MIITKVELENWKNFQRCSVSLTERCFIVGANASGKSNFLDVFRFLHDIVRPGGGLQTAVSMRGGIKKIRCLAARKKTYISLSICVSNREENEEWCYKLVFKGVYGGVVKQEIRVVSEYVSHNDEILLNRKETDLDQDNETLHYTNIEQAITNQQFRDLRDFFLRIDYLNVVPQFVREPDSVQLSKGREDYYGRNFLQRLSLMNEATKRSYFKRVNEILKLAVPQLEELKLVKDAMGVPHLEAKYEHWRAKGSKQSEEQFSDGTLRLIGFLFALLDNKGIILLEEPETNLHSAIVAQFPEFISKIQRLKKDRRQVFITTHSYDMLSNSGIGGDEVVLLRPSAEGTEVVIASSLQEIQNELSAGFSIADSILPMTTPMHVNAISQLSM